MRRTFEFDSSNGAGDVMSTILEYYAEIAYPLGGSECAAASREALRGIAMKLISADFVDISTRQRPMLKSALSWFYSEMSDIQDIGFPEDKINSNRGNSVRLDEEMYERLLSQLQR